MIGHSITDQNDLLHHVTNFVYFWPKGSPQRCLLKIQKILPRIYGPRYSHLQFLGGMTKGYLRYQTRATECFFLSETAIHYISQHYAYAVIPRLKITKHTNMLQDKRNFNALSTNFKKMGALREN